MGPKDPVLRLFQFVPMHVGVFQIGNFAGYLAGGADRGIGLLVEYGPVPSPKYKFMGYLNIEEFYQIGPGA
jgi:hypothetical protein